jgi:hypothetical protein
MKIPFILTPGDIALLDKVSRRTASKNIKKIQAELKLDKNKPITIVHYAKYYQVDIESIKQYLNK